MALMKQRMHVIFRGAWAQLARAGASMFVAIYRWRLYPEREQDFIANWHRITQLGLAAGSGGSSLFKDADGCWVALARWASREAREHFFQRMEGGDADPGMRERTQLAIIERLPAQELESVLDCWASFNEAKAASGP
jgi:heme-degrading monooxygenase HmoA